jgi:hypothetical protein
MNRYWPFVLVLLLTLALPQGSTAQPADGILGQEDEVAFSYSAANDLLINGNMEELPFYWRPPNHFVAGGWQRWWIKGSMPEYDDVREWRPYRYDGNHAQVYFRWGATYTAGIYQRVPGVEPCVFYQFDMYGRNHSQAGANHRARIGLDPLGRMYNTIDSPGVVSLPSDIVWSPEQTYFKIWGPHTVTAEAQTDALTAIAYVSPDPNYGYYDTFWDAGTLVKVLPPNNRFPGSDTWRNDGFVTNVVTSTVVNYMLVEWDTVGGSSTQVWYNAWTPPTSTVTSSVTLSMTTYLPLVLHERPIEERVARLTRQTPPDYTRVTHHQAFLGPLEDGQTVELVTLSRYADGFACRTGTSGLMEVEFHTGPVYLTYLPMAGRGMED